MIGYVGDSNRELSPLWGSHRGLRPDSGKVRPQPRLYQIAFYTVAILLFFRNLRPCKSLGRATGYQGTCLISPDPS